jgi:hypothetical protein
MQRVCQSAFRGFFAAPVAQTVRGFAICEAALRES